MQPLNAAFPIKQIVSGILLCFCPLTTTAQTNLPEVAVYSANWLPVYPQVSVNGSVSDGLYEFISHNNTLLVQNSTLTALGIRVPAELLQQAQSSASHHTAADRSKENPTVDTTGSDKDLAHKHSTDTAEAVPAATDGPWYVLSNIPQLEVQYQAANQTLALTAPLSWLNLPTTRLDNRQEQAYDIAKAGFAAIFNYDYNATRNSNGDTGHGLLAEARLTTPTGYLSHHHLWNHQNPKNGSASSNDVRLDTYWRTVWADQGLVFTAGDIQTSGRSGGTGSSRLGGLRLEHTYSVQPWRNTAPLFSYLGESTLPSTVDLYLNGVKQYNRDVAAGNYEITLPPTISGSGMAQVVATDVLGRTVVTNMPLYGGSGLLAKGLSEWSLEAGYLRKNYGLNSADYDKKLIGSGTWRYGISNALTAQIHAEAGGGYRTIGADTSAVIGTLGQLDLSHAYSRFQTDSGSRSSVFFSTHRGNWSLGTGWSRSGHGFTDLSVIARPDTPLENTADTRTASASLSWNSTHIGNFSLSYLHSRREKETADKIGALNWSHNLGHRVSTFAAVTRNFGDTKQHSIYGGISLNLDKGYYATLSNQRDSDGSNSRRLALSKPSRGLGSPSWNLGWQQQDNHHGGNRNDLNGHFNYETAYGEAHGNVFNTRGATNWNAGWRGGLVMMNGGLFATRTVNNSFAVIDTGGVPNVPVLLSNNRVGETNRQGLLLVPNLLPYQKNTLDIDVTNLPQNIQAERARIQAVPAERSGVAVKFLLEKMQAASLTLKDGNGQVIPSGSSIIRHSDNTPIAVVGFDGQTFIEQLTAGSNRFSVSLPENGGRCRFQITYRPEQYGNDLPDLGETVCTETSASLKIE